MNPNYLDFIRFQDKRIIPFIYGILFIVLGFYWKNNNYSLTQQDVWIVGGILAIMLFNFIYELKAYWAYSYLLGRVDFHDLKERSSFFVDKSILFRPTTVSVFSVLLFALIVYCSTIIMPPIYSTILLYLIAPFIIYLILRCLRPIYIQQLLNSVSSGIRYKNLYHHVIYSVLLIFLLNILSISPLAKNADFSLADGFFSARLIIAMTILCSIVLVINLIFLKASKRYIFLGRIFLKEFDFNFPEQIPFINFHAKPIVIRLLLLLLVLFVWIMCVSTVLSFLQWSVIFEVYFILCFLPCLVYYFLQTYWHWHTELMMACDMYFRYEEIKKRKEAN
ncbi:hypothetical protein AOY20_09715 [Acinetobacter equi]|uniref:Uncharacterized protein n=2 Tax=Acinetobacter equi TaxID=1324350 RepID=A0A0N9WEL9_9GAMM|nr:hypothetical protein AOY20_09715 [Acinetobacter equi]